jgi:flavin reductase (DIM6/NTAB) family NADH-FMN oxidoreductase RutF
MKTPDRIDEMKCIEGREIAALLNPRAAVLVTCCDGQGAPNVLAVAWHTPLSHNPPLVGVSIDNRHYSHQLICQTGEFALNVVPMAFQAAVEFCGLHHGRDMDKLQAAGLAVLPAGRIRPPLIAGALAHLECSLVDQVHTGDHTFFIGKVVYAEARTDCFRDAWQPVRGDVLLCLQRDRYVTWVGHHD